jgi:KaiC/GvpD/RAD55 family RecA-like ATPase
VAEAPRILDIPEIDRPLGTALPAGWLAVLTGSSGSGAPLLAKQFAHAGVGRAPVLFYTTYERTDELRRSFGDFGWDASEIKIVNLADEYYERVLLRGLDAARAREGGLTLEELGREEPRSRQRTSFSLTDRMLADLAGIDAPFRLVVDSVDFFFEVIGARDVISVARQIRHRCQTTGGQALLTLHSLADHQAVYGPLQDLADLALEMRAEPDGHRYAHRLFLEKVGNRPDLTRIWKAELKEGGWKVEKPPAG